MKSNPNRNQIQSKFVTNFIGIDFFNQNLILIRNEIQSKSNLNSILNSIEIEMEFKFNEI